MVRLVTALSLLPIAASCGGAGKNPNAPGDAGGFSWVEPAKGWWKAGDAACPDGGKLVQEEKNDAIGRTCKKGDVEHGPKGIWHKSGNKIVAGLLRDGEPHGVWREWRPDGKLANTLRFEDGVLHGQTIRTDPNGGRIEESYKHGKKHGAMVVKNADGTVLQRAVYENDKLNGKQAEYYPSGKPRLTATYKDGLPDGDVVLSSEAGKELGRFTMKAGNGTWKDFYKNGAVRSETEMKGGLPEGAHKVFFADGQKQLEGGYKNGKPQGTWVLWGPGGLLLSTSQYDQGRPQKVATHIKGSLARIDTFHPSGARASTIGYRAGRKHGPEVQWRADGSRAEQGENRRNKKHGLWTYFAENGEVEKTVTYKNGKRRKRKKGGTKPAMPQEAMELGVGICDHYLRRFLTCNRLPEEARHALGDAWEQLAREKHAVSRGKLEQTCRAASAQWDQNLSSLDC